MKGEFDLFENEAVAFEALGSDATVPEQVMLTSARLDVLESGVRDVLGGDEVHFFALLRIMLNIRTTDFHLSLI